MATVRSEQILVESRDFKDLNVPLTRTSRLRYTSLSVSERLVSLGSNTGGIYIFNKADCKLLQIAFAEKETAAVTLLLISPNEKFVAFSVSTGKIHVIDLKLDTRTKSETLRSVTDTGGAIVTCLKWDSSSTKLFIGDDMGKVTMVPVHTSKAKNLFSIPMEVIMKLDSAVVQIDKADDKLVVSTVTCCYLCNTSRQQYTQIGKKPRDGQFGACFLSQTPTSSMIYCARPGSRIWEVDMEGAVLNTHQFKQLLAVAPLSILDINRNFTPPDENDSYLGQSVAFPKLKIISGRFILTWNSSSIYVLDPVNVRLILWTNYFSGILDIHCVKDEMYVYLSSMQVHCLKLMPVSKAIHTCMSETRIEVVARLCCFYGNILHRKHLRKHLGVADLYKIHNTLEVNEMHDLREEVLKCIKEIENKVAMETDTDTSESGRSRSSSVVSSCSDTSGIVNDSLEVSNSDKTEAKKIGDTKSAIVNGAEGPGRLDKNIDSETGSLSGDLQSAKMDSVMHNGDKKVYELDVEPVKKLGANGSSRDLMLPGDNDKTIIGESAVISDSHTDGKMEDYQSVADSTNDRGEVFKNGPTTPNIEIAKLERGEPEGQSCTIDHVENEIRLNCDAYTSETNQHIAQNGTFVIENDEKRTNFGEEFEVKEMLNDLDKCAPVQMDSVPNSHISSQSCTKYSEAFKSQSPARSISVPLIDNQSVPNDDDDDDFFDDDTFDTSLGDKISFGPRRPSLTSLSSFSSAEVTMDLPFPESEDQIAVQVKRRVSNKKKKKKRKSTSDIFSSNIRGSNTGSPLSLGSSKSLSEDIPDTTVLAREQADSISQHSYGADETDGAGVELIDHDQTNCNATNGDSEKNETEATVQVDIPLIIYNTPTDEYSGSGEFQHSSDWGVSGEFTTSDSTFLQSFEQSTEDKMSVSPTSARKAALRKFKDKMQNQVTSKTKKLIQNIKDKNIISKAKELAETLSQGPDLSLVSGGYLDPHQFDIYNEQMQAADIEAKLKDTNYEVPKEEKPLVDVTDLQEVTDKVKHELEDPRIYSDLEKINKKILTEWITVLNQTFHKFHVKKFAPSVIQGDSLQNSEIVQELSRSNDVSEHHNVETDQTTNSVDLDKPTNSKEETSDFQAVNDKMCVSDVDLELASDNFEKILSDPDFCYLADPLKLPAELLVDVSKYTHVCFEIGYHGNILEYQKLQLIERVSEQNGTIDKSIVCDSNDSATVMNATESNKATCDKIGSNNATDTDTESIRTVSVKTFENGKSADLDHDIVNKNTAEQIDDSQTDTKIEPKSELSIEPKTEPTTGPKTEPKIELTKEPKVQSKAEPATGPTLNAFCDTNTSTPMNFFIRLYYPYLHVHKLHKDVLHYPEWAALVTCLQGCAIDDGERLGVKHDSIISHVLDSQHQKNGGLILLGHISRLFYTKDQNVLEACVQCYPHIQPIDVLYLCCYHGVVIELVFRQYIFKMLDHLRNIHKPDIEGCLFSNSQVRHVWLELLLGEGANTDRLMDKLGNPRLMSHKEEWKNEQLLQQMLSKLGTYCDTDAKDLLSLFYKYGYWKGILQLLKQLKNNQEHCRVILYLGDIELLSDSHPLGYLPSNLDEWEYLLVTYKNSGSQESDSELSDWSTCVTWNSLAILLVKNVGPQLAVSLLKKVGVEEGALDPDFYKTCLLSSMVQKQKRLILHSMLEKVDMYLWSQRPAAVTPQLHYLLVNEERIKTESSETGDQAIQSMTAMLKADKSVQHLPLSEDPDCHWGVKTRFNMLCGCCNIPLKETVSHTQSGVLLFRCGHGFHKQCLPDRECILCDDDDDGLMNLTGKIKYRQKPFQARPGPCNT